MALQLISRRWQRFKLSLFDEAKTAARYLKSNYCYGVNKRNKTAEINFVTVFLTPLLLRRLSLRALRRRSLPS